MYKHNITVRIIAKTIKKIPNGIVHPPNEYETTELTNEKIANTNKSKIATTNDIIGMFLGKQWVRTILIRPNPIAIKNV